MYRLNHSDKLTKEDIIEKVKYKLKEILDMLS